MAFGRTNIATSLSKSLSFPITGRNNWTPRKLFLDGTEGIWYDIAPQYAYQDSAGITQASVGDPVGLLLDRHIRDGRGVVNLLLHTDDTTKSAWLKLASGTGSVPVITSNYADDPGGSQLADRVQFDRGAGTTTSDRSRLYQNAPDQSGSCISVWLRSTDGVSEYSMILQSGTGVSTITVTGEYQRFTTPSASSALNFQLFVDGTTGQTADILLSRAQAERAPTPSDYQPNGATVGGPGHHATQSTAASRPILRQDAGGRYWADDDEVDDSMTVTLPALSATTTVGYSRPGTGASISTVDLSAGGAYTVDGNYHGLVIVPDISAANLAKLTSYLNRIAGV